MKEKTLFKGYRFEHSDITLNPLTKNETFKIAPHFECKMTGNNETYNATLSVTINSSVAGNKTPFDLNVVLTGAFELGEDLVSSKKGQLRLAIETLFPYLRAFVTNLTVSCGMPPFILPFVDTEQMVSSMHEQSDLPN